jgi:2-keto-3-deoxy-L-rhamnonate aldolase RhmA
MSLKQKLNAGELVLATMVNEMRTPTLPTILSAAGLDSFVIDMEHGTHDWSDMAALVGVARGLGLHAIVRIPEIRRETVLKPLDAGAAGILVPMVNTAEEATQIVQWAKYPPAGVRGVSLRRGHNDFRSRDLGTYLSEANDSTAVIIQIETEQSVDNIEDLVRVEGVDCVFIGPNDLSVALGAPGQLGSDVMREACETILKAARESGVAVGYQSFDIAQARVLVEQGVRYLSFTSDVHAIMDTFSGLVQAASAWGPRQQPATNLGDLR